MYSDEQRRSHIYDLQRFLRRIEQEQGYPQPLAPDGIFGPETEAGVKDFQRRNGIPITGTVNYDTWTRIFGQYLALTPWDTMPAAVLFFPTGMDVKLTPGSKGIPVLALQMLLNTPIKHYANLAPIPLTGEYDAATANAVRKAQRSFQLPETGVTDRVTWDALALLHNSLFEHTPLEWVLGGTGPC